MPSVFQLVMAHGGWTLAAIGALSLVALAVAIERGLRLVPLRGRFQASHRAFLEVLMRSGPAEAESAVLQEPDHAMTRVLRAALSVRLRGVDAVRVVALDAAQREVPEFERGLSVLLIAAQVAPLLGLLGTVVGLIEAFRAAATASAVTPAMLADGLYKALGTTVAGLWVAIPAFIAYGIFANISGRLADQLEHAAIDLPLLVVPPVVAP
jgi:biopolymer transport protein ExbB